MKRAATVRTIFWALVVIFSAVLLLPWGNLVMAAPAPCCHHGGGGGPGISSGNCCQPGGPGHCGSSGQTGTLGCRCRASNLVFISPPAANSPTWQVSSYCLSLVTVSTKLFPPNIFHPPEPSYLSTLI